MNIQLTDRIVSAIAEYEATRSKMDVAAFEAGCKFLRDLYDGKLKDEK